jgi:hypothetical protein
MINVTKVTVRSFDLDHLDVFWEIENFSSSSGDATPHEIFDYEFFVLRSGDSAMGPFDTIAGPFRDRYMMRDVQVSLLHKWRQYYYKIRVVSRKTGESKDFGPAGNFSPGPDLIAAEIVRQEDVLFREHSGRKAYLFNRRTFGPRCSCWDDTLQRRTRSGHLPCYDTGFLGGYMSPIEIHVQIDPPGKVKQATALGDIQPGDTAGRMICFPPVNPDDIIVEAENKRWKVMRVVPTERLRAIVRQEFVLHEIPKTDVEYELPVRVNLRDLEPSAARNYTNPQNIEKNEDDVSDILQFFGKVRGSLG